MVNMNDGFGCFDDEVEKNETSSAQIYSNKKGYDVGTSTALNQRYLIFNMYGTKYVTTLLASREVIEVTSFRVIPNAMEYFLGIANI